MLCQPASTPFNRREWLRVGGLGALGLSLPSVLKAKPKLAGKDTSFGRAKSCILLFLSGGPPQHETFDPKPDAPLEIRGDIKSIATSVPGVHFSEVLPRTARLAHRMSVIRSMTTGINAHSTSGAFMLTGYEPLSKAENVPAGGNDWPSIAAAVGALKPSKRSPLSSVVLPEWIENNGHIVWPGQNGGFMGSAWHPQMIKCDPSAQRLRIEGMSLAEGMTEMRFSERGSLLRQLDTRFRAAVANAHIDETDAMHQRAFDLIHSEASRAALEIEREPAAMRDRYGRGKFGQSVLLARRLIEAGTRLVQVNWAREPEDQNAGSPLWDTHQRNAQRVREVLAPQFDQAYAALIEDLQSRGLLDETLIVVMGEFGRSPTINKSGGRDHWGNVFSVALAGAGVPGGQIIGASDKIGGYPEDRPVRPPELAATLFHLLGIQPNHEFLDPIQRPRLVTDSGVPLREIVGI
ncbi:MAG: DUF1501 domain-containing protein [Prosthecobacter sp.]|jgi:hypothetical protein|uniref:DUF1501 domain-containing protein n=1 Tax=Prosthecobacter sp. TaxID=1965333 RepID=UPI0019FAF21D|nr:DUF1501 domain-containing protein [Prosthecobacter sp.]MBE2285598.1 DUF1501 domain-containing protein [Prosthecobacter sp.]